MATLNAIPCSNVAVEVAGALNTGAEEREADESAVASGVGSALASGIAAALGAIVFSVSAEDVVAGTSVVAVGVADGSAEASAVAPGLAGVSLLVSSVVTLLWSLCCSVGSAVGRITVPPMIHRYLPHESDWCSE